MPDQQQFIDAATDDLQQHMTGDLQPSARGLSGNRSQPGQCNSPNARGPEMSSTRPQARGEISRLDVIRLLAFRMSTFGRENPRTECRVPNDWICTAAL